MNQLEFITQRYDNLLLTLPTLKKHQRGNKYGTIINMPDPEQGDNWTSLENELNQWGKELKREVNEETKKYCKSRMNRIKDQMTKRGYAPEDLKG